MRLENFLAAKPLFYEKIDYERFPNIYKKIEKYFILPKIVHIVGTNAKGSTGRALAHLLHVKGYKVGHYSSPHILKFNERIWVNGLDVEDNLLESTHKKLQNILDVDDSNALSYFEYTTLLAMLIFCENCEYVVLEAGLGGEYDATNVFKKELSIVTPIGYDHESFLGHSIEEIANTKLRSINNDALLAKQYDNMVYDLALKRVNEIKRDLFFADSFLEDEFYDDLKNYIQSKNYPAFFYNNFSTAFCAYRLLGFEVDVNLLDGLKLFGRCQKISNNVTIDVGHNPMAASVLLEHFRTKKVVLVYNSYNDKEYTKILSILHPIIQEVQIIDISNEREVLKSSLEEALNSQNIKYSQFKKIEKDLEYLVFGSFSVVEKFLNAR
ncbi:folylpolyglutamate synthase [Sulfurospirillum arcachonense]|uniref:folylpolyglutamate synthase n=1 Tax=Sulfurospirillum arcachonense TaxID=57666 RepID=UPI0004693909|nr:folylpolyglutamate synthase [Sulfurospirillum arcachonense]